MKSQYYQFFPSPKFLGVSFLFVVWGLSSLVSAWYTKNVKIEIAAQNGDLGQIKELLRAKPALVSSRYYLSGGTPLHVAALRDHKDVVAFLLANGADINAKDNFGMTPLHYAAINGHEDVTELLLANKAEVNVHDAAALGDLHKLKALIQANPALVSSKDDMGATPLYWAAWAGRMDAAKFLLSNEAEINARNKGGQTPLTGAAGQGRMEVVQWLLANGAEVDARTNNGSTPLFGATWMNHKDVAELLLANKADVNARNSEGETPLTLAIRARSGNLVALLRQYGGIE
jgi:ankyrin repeat protein